MWKIGDGSLEKDRSENRMKKCFLMLALLLWVSGMTACSAQNGQSPRGQEQDTAGMQKQGEETSLTEFFAMDTYMAFTADGD